MAMKLKLAHKGLFLVAVPLVFELIFVAILFVLLERAETMVEREARSREIISTTNDMSKDLFDCAYALVGWNYTKGEMFRKQFEQCYKAIPDGMVKLKVLCKSNKRQEEHLIKLEKISATVLSELEEQKENIENSKNVYGLDFGAYRKKLSDIFAPFISELKELSKEEKKIQEKAPRATKESREQLRQFLLLGIGLNVVVALWLSSFFSREITGRLGVMMENAEKFAKGKALGKLVGGQDEVAELDGVFHKMAEALILAEKQKREFVNMISHDLRSPLNSIQGTLEIMQRGAYGTLTDKGLLRVKDAEEETERLLSLINELLDVEKAEAGMLDLSFSKVKLKSIISKTLNAIGGIAEKKGQDIIVDAEELELSCDPERLVQILVNLLSNAIKFSPPDKEIRLSVRTLPEGGVLEFKVTDNGPGIPDDAKEKIFERFEQIKEEPGGERRGGSGLGLSICKALVHGHGGVIGVESEVGKGSTFWFRIPIGNDNPPKAT